MTEALVLRPDPGRGYSPRAPFFQHAAMEIADDHLTVVDQEGVRQRFQLGDGPGQASRLAIVHNFSIVMGLAQDVTSARSWLLVVDGTNTAIVATDLDAWDETEVHTWWCRVHGGMLDGYLTEPDAPQGHLPRTDADRTVLLQPTRGTGIWLAGIAFTVAVLLALVPAFTDLPGWLGLIPAAIVIAALVVIGGLRGRQADRARAERLRALEARIPPGRAGTAP